MKCWLQSGRQRQLLIKSLQGSSEFCLHLFCLPSFLLLCSSPSPPYPPTEFLLNIPHAILAHNIRGKNPTQQNWSNLTAILICWVMGKRCPKQQQKVFFSIRWVLRDMTSVFLTFPSILKIQSLKELYCTTFLQNVFTQGQSMDYLPPLQQSLKLSATEVTHHLTKLSSDRF